MLKNPTRKAIEIKISTVVAVAALLHDSDLAVLTSAMQEITGGEPDYFDGEFAIVDLEGLNPEQATIDWPGLIALFKSFNLNLVAARNVTAAIEPEILAHGLSLDVIAKTRQAAIPTQAVSAITPIAAPPGAPQLALPSSLIIDTPVRAGQRIYARDCDLIITAAVNNGAEVIADGSIHIYAPLRGRALAGAKGDSNARIFAMDMKPELVSIAGIYRTFEEGIPKKCAFAPTQVRLNGDRIELLAISEAIHK